MDEQDERRWNVTRAVELGTSADEVWGVIGGFFTIHHWHPDITELEILADQPDLFMIRRRLTFPGQPTTTEELTSMDNDDHHYTYRWHAGAWGEAVKDYHASLRAFDLDEGRRCAVQWSSTFVYHEDAISEFYWNGFRALQDRFPLTTGA